MSSTDLAPRVSNETTAETCMEEGEQAGWKTTTAADSCSTDQKHRRTQQAQVAIGKRVRTSCESAA
eukprot:4476872-Pleurochrysis_carterae.AAC.1